MSRVNDSEHLLVKKQTKKTQQVALWQSNITHMALRLKGCKAEI